MSKLLRVPDYIAVRESKIFITQYFLSFWHIRQMGPLNLDQAQEVIDLLNAQEDHKSELANAKLEIAVLQDACERFQKTIKGGE